jgi:hypothetical protein
MQTGNASLKLARNRLNALLITLNIAGFRHITLILMLAIRNSLSVLLK